MPSYNTVIITHVLFYVPFLQTGAHSPLQSKEQNNQNNFHERECAHWRTHTHTYIRVLQEPEVRFQRHDYVWLSNLVRETVPDRQCSIRKRSLIKPQLCSAGCYVQHTHFLVDHMSWYTGMLKLQQFNRKTRAMAFMLSHASVPISRTISTKTSGSSATLSSFKNIFSSLNISVKHHHHSSLSVCTM